MKKFLDFVDRADDWFQGWEDNPVVGTIILVITLASVIAVMILVKAAISE